MALLSRLNLWPPFLVGVGYNHFLLRPFLLRGSGLFLLDSFPGFVEVALALRPFFLDPYPDFMEVALGGCCRPFCLGVCAVIMQPLLFAWQKTKVEVVTSAILFSIKVLLSMSEIISAGKSFFPRIFCVNY